MKISKLSAFAIFAWAILAYNLFIVIWGAYVRASGSGAGCGAHWPLCNGVIVPQSPQIQTIVEFTHRVTSGLTVILIAVMIVWAWRKFPRRSPIRITAALTGLFIITEALIGARLVLFGLVGGNDSSDRAFAVVTHLVNTFLLLAVNALTAWWASSKLPDGFHWRGLTGWGILASLLALLVLGASGAIAALGDTLFPATSLSAALQQDFSGTAHILLRLRVFHPVIAVTTALLSGGVAYWLRGRYQERRLQTLSLLLISFLALQIALGVTNVALLAPVWMQLVHLTVSELVWLSLVLLASVTIGTADLLPRLVHDHVDNRVENTERVG